MAELCRDRLSRPVCYFMGSISELAAMAKDLTEFLGGAIGLSLLFGMPLLVGMAVTAMITYAILLFDRRGFGPTELVIDGFVWVIGLYCPS